MTVTGNYALRLPKSLKEDVAALSKEDGTTINQFIVVAVARQVAELKARSTMRLRGQRGNVQEALAALDRMGTEPPSANDTIPSDLKSI
jgi:predicted DNA-binding protein